MNKIRAARIEAKYSGSKAQEQKKTEKQGNKWKSFIPVILLAVLVAAGVIAFVVLKYQEGVRRQEAMKLMQENRRKRPSRNDIWQQYGNE